MPQVVEPDLGWEPGSAERCVVPPATDVVSIEHPAGRAAEHELG